MFSVVKSFGQLRVAEVPQLQKGTPVSEHTTANAGKWEHLHLIGFSLKHGGRNVRAVVQDGEEKLRVFHGAPYISVQVLYKCQHVG